MLWHLPRQRGLRHDHVARGFDADAVGARNFGPHFFGAFAFHRAGAHSVDADVVGAEFLRQPREEWISPLGRKTRAPAARTMHSAGYASEEAARVQCPVFVGYGERDVGVNPWEEPRYYWRSRDVQVAVIPRMSHGMNSASTREQMWRRIQHWATGVSSWRTDEPLP